MPHGHHCPLWGGRVGGTDPRGWRPRRCGHREIDRTGPRVPRHGRPPQRRCRRLVLRCREDGAIVSSGADVYIGDTVTDIAAGRDAAVATIGVTTGPDDQVALSAAGADIVISDLGAARE